MDNNPPHPPRYVMLNNNSQGSIRPPPNRRNIPRYHSSGYDNSGGNCCLRCICCCYCCLFLSVFLSAALSFFLYSMYQPQAPTYKLDHFEVEAFNVQQDFSLDTEFALTVKADNPNEHIGFTYGKNSLVSVSYHGTILCSGKIPAFHQPHKNISLINVVLRGKSEFASGLQEAFSENKKSGKIPLLVQVKAPVAVTVGQLTLREVVVFVNCSFNADNLAPNKKVEISSTKYSYKIEL